MPIKRESAGCDTSLSEAQPDAPASAPRLFISYFATPMACFAQSGSGRKRGKRQTSTSASVSTPSKTSQQRTSETQPDASGVAWFKLTHDRPVVVQFEMAAKVTPKLWEMSDMIAALESWEAAQTEK